MDALNSVLNVVDSSLSVLRTNPYASGATTLFLVLYAGLAAPALPASVAGLFEHSLFKLLILTLVLLLVKNQNPTTAILVAVAFVVSMNTLSKYRVFTMANDLSNLVGSAPSGKVAKPSDSSYGPDGLASEGSVEEIVIDSKGSNHKTKIRGHHYSHDDEPNLLPGGHGDMAQNAGLQSAAALHPNGAYQGPQGMQVPTGYDGDLLATVGGPDSQL